MTLTASPATEMAGDGGFTGDSDRDLMSTKQGTKSTGINTNRTVTQDVSTVLGKENLTIIQSNLSTMATLWTKEIGCCGGVAIMGR